MDDKTETGSMGQVIQIDEARGSSKDRWRAGLFRRPTDWRSRIGTMS